MEQYSRRFIEELAARRAKYEKAKAILQAKNSNAT